MSKQKTLLLGENFSTANSKLRKMIMFSLVQQLEKDDCFRCGLKIEDVKDLSVEHTESWQCADNPAETFYDISKIAFSHLSCNSGTVTRYARIKLSHGTRACYKRGCRCVDCRKANSEYIAYLRRIDSRH